MAEQLHEYMESAGQVADHGAMMMAGFAAIAHDMNSSWTTIPKLGADNDDDNEDDQLIYNEFSSLWD